MPLLDSNILIYAVQPANAFLDAWLTAADAAISAVSIPEVLGFTQLTEDDELIFEAWFARLRVLPITDGILYAAARLRRERRMKLGDAIVAATALDSGKKLVTRNLQDFEHLAELQLINPFDRL